jgi:hypothetical protein
MSEFDGPLRAGRLSAALADAFTVAIGRYNARIRSSAASDPHENRGPWLCLLGNGMIDVLFSFITYPPSPTAT